MPAYDIREYRPGDEESILATFRAAFAADGDSVGPPRTPEQWRWAFRDNPAGHRIWVAAFEGKVVAQYAALPSRVLVEGRESHFAQIVDSMVHPEHRMGLKRPGLFVQTALPFFDHYCGPEKDLVNYGWPIESAWRIGKTFLKYEVVRTQPVLSRGVGDFPGGIPDEVEEIARFDEQARWLYDRCAGAFGASTIRDAAFLNWRFLDNPQHDYTCYGVRDGEGILRGYAVYRLADWYLPNLGLVVDWLVPPDEPEVGELLHRAVCARGRADHANAMAVILPEWSPWFEDFQDRHWRVHPSPYFMVGRNFHARYDMLWLRDSWWYQFADTDLV